MSKYNFKRSEPIKITILGDQGVGKSTLLNSYQNRCFAAAKSKILSTVTGVLLVLGVEKVF